MGKVKVKRARDKERYGLRAVARGYPGDKDVFLHQYRSRPEVENTCYGKLITKGRSSRDQR